MDPIKLVKQEPEFEKWLREVSFRMIMSQPAPQKSEFIRSMWAFYSSGLKPVDMEAFMKTWNMFTPPEE